VMWNHDDTGTRHVGTSERIENQTPNERETPRGINDVFCGAI
jgi:hypothetical protein